MSDTKLRPYLLPLACLYGVGVWVRDQLFRYGILRSRSFSVPTVCIGNLAAGGTGKTPHTEYLIRLLRAEGYRVATLSRGYGRRTHGYLRVEPTDTPARVGDEPCQMKRKFPEATVAVCADRCHGIDRLMISYPTPDVILLDDAYQHRYVQAGLTILLTDYSRLYSDDLLLPAGRLREPREARRRADVVIVTKCPPDIKPIDFNITTKRLGLQPYQKLFFTGLRYGRLYAIGHPETERDLPAACEHVVALTGIARPAPLVDELRRHTPFVTPVAYPDHHTYVAADLRHLRHRLQTIAAETGTTPIVVTTEKDATRLQAILDPTDTLNGQIYVAPIQVCVLQDKESAFHQTITHYVRTHQRNRRLP